MQIEALRVFCDVVQTQSFSKAARDHHLSQSAVSQIVGQLEHRLGAQLIVRGRPLSLTDLGRDYYDGCKRVVEEYEELEAKIRRTQSELAANVHVAAIYSVGLGDMGQLVARFVAEHPNVQIHIDYVHPDTVYQRVRNGTADFGLVSFPRKGRDLELYSWREEEMVLTCWPGHPVAHNSSVRPRELTGERYIGFDRRLVIRRQVDRFLREQKVNVEVTHEFDSIENIKKAIEIGAGVALLPAPTLQREVEAGTLVAVPLAGCRLRRPLGIIQRRHHRLNLMARRFLALLRRSDSNGSEPRSSDFTQGRNGATRRPAHDGQ
jgi:DNA-binding transcriptional LysR family regulator